MVDYLDRFAESQADWDRMSPRERFAALRRKEREAIQEQVGLCIGDFCYAARNYFWITTKQAKDMLFTLWHSQWLVLQKYNDLKSHGRPQRIMILKARQLGMCLDPDTKVLTAEMRWVRIEELKPGQEIVSVDENIPGGRGCGRKMRRATVVAKRCVFKSAFRLTMDNGETLVATAEHRFLCRRRGGTEAIWRMVGKGEDGRKSHSPIQVGDYVRRVADTWEGDPSYEDGWFGGMLDGEGSLRKKDRAGAELCVSQVEGPVLERARDYLSSRGYSFRAEIDNRKAEDSSKLGDRPVAKFVIGRMDEIFHLVGKTRPTRFLSKDWWEGKDLPGRGAAGDGAWSKVISIEALPAQTMIDLQTSTKTFIANGFVSHNSTLIEAMLAWRAMFYRNTRGMVVSSDEDHSAFLFNMLLHIYEQMPWWLRPEAAALKYEDGLQFDNPDRDDRRLHPGMNSHIYVQHASQTSGVGQGRTINAAHLSEYTDWYQPKAKEIIEGDMLHAIADNPECFGFLESTGRGAGTYSHMLWRTNVNLGELAEWYPLFLPWFFEPTRVIAPPQGWRPDKQEHLMAERVKSEWVQCDTCSSYEEAAWGGESRVEAACPNCEGGKLLPAVLGLDQLYWKAGKRRNAEGKDIESLKKHKEEMATSAEEAWQLSGICVFDDACFEMANVSLRDPAKTPSVKRGFLDSHGRFHGVNGKHCYIHECRADHTFDDVTFTVWEEPQRGRVYAFGCDISEGIGQDYSVIAVNKLGIGMGPDEQVAVWRSNLVDPLELAFYCNWIGRWYFDAMACIEYNTGFRVTADQVRIKYQYPNVFRWKHLDSTNPMSAKFHWFTMYNTKPKLWQTWRKWVKAGLMIVRSPNTLVEMQTFQKDEEDSQSAGHERGAHDDELIASMISLYCPHEMESDEGGNIPIPQRDIEESEPARYVMACKRCGEEWGAGNPENERCPRCGCVVVEGRPLEEPGQRGCSYDQVMDLLNTGPRANNSAMAALTGRAKSDLSRRGQTPTDIF